MKISNYQKVLELVEPILNNSSNSENSSSSINFANLMSDAVNRYDNQIHLVQNITTEQLFKDANISDIIMLMSELELGIKAGIAIRDKVISAYNEIINMPI